MSLQVVILAAGQGKRMQSRLPKVLHALAGRALISHVVDTVKTLKGAHEPIVIFGHEGERLRAALPALNVQWVLQEKQAGTGHAVLQAMPFIQDDAHVLILCADVPLISAATLTHLIEKTPINGLGLLTAVLNQPYGYGRILRNADGHVISIVEERDANDAEKAIQEINTGIYYVPARYLREWLPQLGNQNHQGEFYLTDIIAFAVKAGLPIQTAQPASLFEIRGVNDRMQLAELEREYQRNQANQLMSAGVTLLDPARLDIRGEVHVGKDTIIDVNVILEGKVTIGENCHIGANVILKDCSIADHVNILPNTIIEGAQIASHAKIGPFARIRPETVLEESTHVGNFVEIKKSKIGTGSKVNHLTYVGDAIVGSKVNIGAGTITCNYDGANKHQTIIEDDAFIGSSTQLVAPVRVGAGATIGAGSTITQDAPAQQLTLSRVPQRSIAGWERPKKTVKT